MCTLAHTRGTSPAWCTHPAARSGVLVGAAQKGPKASSYTTTAAINQCCRRTVKQYDVASIIDGNPSSAFRDFSYPTIPTPGWITGAPVSALIRAGIPLRRGHVNFISRPGWLTKHFCLGDPFHYEKNAAALSRGKQLYS